MKNFLKIQQNIVDQNKNKIHELSKNLTDEFLQYEKEYYENVSNSVASSSLKEIENRITKSDIAYIGDYHTLRQPKDTFLEILKLAKKKSPKIAVFLGVVNYIYQNYLDDYLTKKSSEKTFFKNIKFNNNYIGFTQEFYLPIFKYLKRHKIPTFGIDNIEVSLAMRNKLSGDIITEAIKQFPDHKFLVFTGDLHIAPRHLPSQVISGLQQLFIFQNSEDIFFKVATEKKPPKYLKISKNKFCTNLTHPILKQQSYLNWAELNEDIPILEDKPKQKFTSIAKKLLKLTNIKKKLPKFSVFSWYDFGLLDKLSKNYSKKELQEILQQVMKEESLYLPKKKYVFIGNFSLNHIAEEASHMIKLSCAPEGKITSKQNLFFYHAFNEAIGFLGSKIITKSRIAPHESEVSQAMQALNLKSINKLSTEEFRKYSHILGYQLGDKIYRDLALNKISKKDITKLFKTKFSNKDDIAKIFFSY